MHGKCLNKSSAISRGMDPLYLCARCKKKVPHSEIRYSRDGKKLVCKSCYSSQHGGEEEPPLKSYPTPNDPGDRELLEDMDDPSKELSLPEAPLSARGTAASKRVVPTLAESVIQRAGSRVTYLCTGCRYKFTIGRTSRIDRKCPYCGNPTLLEVTDVSTDDLVDDY